MATQQSAQVFITNSTDGYGTIALFHNNSTNGTQTGTWSAAPGERVGPLTVRFETGWDVGFVWDYWAVELTVMNGAHPGVYQSAGFANMTDWKECQLRASDAGKDLFFTVDTSRFSINLPSGGCPAAMQYVGPYAAVSHVFVLMLENHSFDNIFAFSGIPGIAHATSANSETYKNVPYPVGSPAPASMHTDPGHEFLDTVEQLCGPGAKYQPGQPYPPPGAHTGFVANYATTTTEITPGNPSLPTQPEWGDVMTCFNTPSQLPVIYQLATEFALCDQWFSSIPGPTWPNRFFVHGASSAGWDDSPSSDQIKKWMVPGYGFTYPHGSIYDALRNRGIQWRIYADEDENFLGGIPQVAALKGIQWPVDVRGFDQFAGDLQSPYPYTYTFIEPNYGDIYDGSYTGGSSQHPMDGVAGGEGLIKRVYEALRASPLWDSSLLIITYDEHGGFYDSVEPPAAAAPGDGSPTGLPANKHGFAFQKCGVRVPAVIVSPLIAKGVVDHTVYDHASVLATVERLYALPPLTERDKQAKDVVHLLSLTTPRTDCPATLHDPVPPAAKPALTAAARAETSARPLPEAGNLPGFLGVVAKTDLELAEGDPAATAAIQARVGQITTRRDAQVYAQEVYAKVQAARASQAKPAEPAVAAGATSPAE